MTFGDLPPSLRPLRITSLRDGETYDSWLCKQCGGVIALAKRSARSDPMDMPNGEIRLLCRSCNSEQGYEIHARRVRRYPW
jgi:RNase P subunit RPR2